MKEIEVRDKSFKIELVNNWVSRKYSEEFYPKSIELGMLINSIEAEATEALKNAKPEEYNKVLKEQADIIKEKKKQANILDREVYEMQFELVQELLESNDLEYDDHWWRRRTSKEDVGEFLVLCIDPKFEKLSKTKKKVG